MGECHHELHIVPERKPLPHEAVWDRNAQQFVPRNPEPAHLVLANDDDSYYYEEFYSREELQAFINKLWAVADELWPPDASGGA